MGVEPISEVVHRTLSLKRCHSDAPCSPRDSQESSPMPQFKSTNSSVFSFLYGPTLTSIHDYWLHAGPFQSASLLFALPEARDR